MSLNPNAIIFTPSAPALRSKSFLKPLGSDETEPLLKFEEHKSPAPTDESLVMLNPMFPDVEKSVISSLFKQNGCDMVLTVQSLISYSTKNEEHSYEETPEERAYKEQAYKDESYEWQQYEQQSYEEQSYDGQSYNGQSYERHAYQEWAQGQTFKNSENLPLEGVEDPESSPSPVQTSSPDQTQSPDQTPAEEPQKEICKFYFYGECLVKNCKFLHSTEICKFFIRGHCYRGDLCRYRHAANPDELKVAPPMADKESSPSSTPTHNGNASHGPPMYNGNTSNGATEYNGSSSYTDSVSENDPSIASSGDYSPESKSEANSPTRSSLSSDAAPFELTAVGSYEGLQLPYQNYNGFSRDTFAAECIEQEEPSMPAMTLAAQMSMKELTLGLPHIYGDVIEQTFRGFGFHFQKTKTHLLTAYGPVPEKLKSQAPPPPKKPDPIPHPSINYRQRDNTKPAGWVNTGFFVGVQYKKLRKDAIAHCHARDRNFQQAAVAFKEGDKKRATELSATGRYHQAEMKRLNHEASEKIYESRNQYYNTNKGRTMIDLHGLHKKEAINKLQTKLRELNGSKVKQVDVIVGTGHHNSQGKSLLSPSVCGYLGKKKYNYKELPAGGRGGTIRVFFK